MLEEVKVDFLESQSTGKIKNQIISLKVGKSTMNARVVSFRLAIKIKIYTFITNMFDAKATTIAKLYKNRWEIEPFFKQLKKNFELKSF